MGALRTLIYANAKCDQAITLSDDINTLLDWLRRDIPGIVDPNLRTREQLFDFVVAELRVREEQAPHQTRPTRRKLENQKGDLFRCAGLIDQRLLAIADDYDVDDYRVR